MRRLALAGIVFACGTHGDDTHSTGSHAQAVHVGPLTPQAVQAQPGSELPRSPPAATNRSGGAELAFPRTKLRIHHRPVYNQDARKRESLAKEILIKDIPSKSQLSNQLEFVRMSDFHCGLRAGELRDIIATCDSE